MNKENDFRLITNQLATMLELKNEKYGNSFGKLRERYKFPIILIRLNDKISRLEYLLLNNDSGTEDERVEDTLLDLAGYCILELNARKKEKESKKQSYLEMSNIYRSNENTNNTTSREMKDDLDKLNTLDSIFDYEE